MDEDIYLIWLFAHEALLDTFWSWLIKTYYNPFVPLINIFA